MDLKEAIEEEHSRRQAEAIADYVQDDPVRLKELWEKVRDGEPPLPQRGSYAMTVLHDRDKTTWSAFVPEFVRHLEKEGHHDAVYRNLYRSMADLPLPKDEDLQGALLEVCFEALNSAKSAIAIKVHALEVLYRLCLVWPELKNELVAAIQIQMPYGSTGFKNRANKILKRLEKVKERNV